MEYVFLNIQLVLILLLHFTYGGPTCLSCTNVPSGSDCSQTQRCADHEICFTDTFVTPNGYITTDVGCRDTLQCKTTLGRRFINESRNSRESNNVAVCSECCQGDICNSELCGQSGFGLRGTRGPLCYSCDDIYSPGSCDKIRECGRDEECMLSSGYHFSGVSTRYTSRCSEKRVCDALRQTYNSGKRSLTRANSICFRCCSDDLCNNECGNSTATTTTPWVPTTSPLAPTRVFDNCLLNPCVHGHCTGNTGGYICTCNAGYSGINCDLFSG